MIRARSAVYRLVKIHQDGRPCLLGASVSYCVEKPSRKSVSPGTVKSAEFPNNGNARWAIERYKLWRPNGLLDERE
jgi:hypothetical protein